MLDSAWDLQNGSDYSSCGWLNGSESERQSAAWAWSLNGNETWTDFSLEFWTCWNGLGSQTCSCAWSRMQNAGGGRCYGYGSEVSESGSDVHGTETWNESGTWSEICYDDHLLSY